MPLVKLDMHDCIASKLTSDTVDMRGRLDDISC